MKKVLLFSAFISAAFASFAQDCSSAVNHNGHVTTQVQKASCSSVGNLVTATLWLSSDENGTYLHIYPVVNQDNKPFNIKAEPKERIQLTFVDGRVADTRMIIKSGAGVVIMLGSNITEAWDNTPVENIAWFENNAMEPSLELMVSDKANNKLMQALHCMK